MHHYVPLRTLTHHYMPLRTALTPLRALTRHYAPLRALTCPYPYTPLHALMRPLEVTDWLRVPTTAN